MPAAAIGATARDNFRRSRRPSILAHEAHPRLHSRRGVLALCDRAQVGALVLAQLRVRPVGVVDLRERTW